MKSILFFYVHCLSPLLYKSSVNYVTSDFSELFQGQSCHFVLSTPYKIENVKVCHRIVLYWKNNCWHNLAPLQSQWPQHHVMAHLVVKRHSYFCYTKKLWNNRNGVCLFSTLLSVSH